MRHNYTYTAAAPSSRNEFIDFIGKQEPVIVVGNTLLEELTKEINSNISDKKSGKFFKKIAIPMAIISWTNPIGWLLSGITFLCGSLLGSADDFKKLK